MFYRSLRLLALALSLGPAFAAAPPDWLLPHLSPEARAWKMSEPATALIDSTECRQLTADRVQYHAMGAILVHNPETGGPKAVATLGYSTDKTKITDVRAWVINPAGKATAVGRSQFSDIGVSDPRFWIGQRMLVYKPDEPMPNGSILAWEFSYESNTGPLDTIDWRANNLPTRQAKIQVVPLPDTILSWHAYNPKFPAPAIDPVTHRHVWNLDEITVDARAKPRGYLPPLNRISLHLSPSGTMAGQYDTWTGVARSLSGLVTPKLALTSELKAQAESLVAGQTGRWDRIRALTDFVQRQVSYLAFMRETDYLAGCRPQAAGDTLKNRYGDCKDKAALLIVLLRAIGEDGHLVLLFATDPRQVCSQWPALVFNHAITAIPAGPDAPVGWPIVTHPTLGRLVIVDATTPRGALGVLPPYDQAGPALVVHDEQGALVSLPAGQPALGGIDVQASLAVETNGDLAATLREIRQGQPGVDEHLARENLPADRLRARTDKRLHEIFTLYGGLQATDAWNAATLFHTQDFRLTAPRFGHRAGKDLLLVNTDCTPHLDAFPAWKSEESGLVFLEQEQIKQEVRLALPSGASVSALPTPLHAEYGQARVDITCVQEDNVVIHRCHYLQPAGLYEKADYDALRSLRQKYLQGQKRPVILKLTNPIASAPLTRN